MSTRTQMTAMFTAADIDKDLKLHESGAVREIIEVLSYVGENFVNIARNTQTYRDQTGNLRSSIGYVIAIDGVIITKNISGQPEGVKKANDISEEIVGANPSGIVLIGFAGMEYAAAVESKGYDVISNSVISADQMFAELKKGLGL